MESKSLGAVDPSVYTDLTELSKLKALAGKDEKAALREVAQQFEQVFMNMMLKSMRQANEAFAEDDPLYSSEVQFYQGMLDQQLTLDLSKAGGLGLAEIIVKQLGQSITSGTGETESTGVSDLMFNMATRRVASHSLSAVDEISDQLARERVMSTSTQVSESEETSADRSIDTPQDVTFNSPAEFVEVLMPMAEKAAQALGVDPKVLVAQAALETGWGRSIIRDQQGNSSNNLFNIKADSRWSGESVGVQTLEYRDGLPQPERAEFRAYKSLEAGMNDYVDFIQSNPRYEQARELVEDPVAYLQALQQAGYATDPEYAAKIERILGGTSLAMAVSGSQEG
ncbi:Flagellar protein FlgJ [Marinobacterium lacunae]|uniref:Peptidoglycan hydrolase FlgJ n=1 Tax=Marinobacterium lacunae TaxID=1232683 RepID=A0A081G0L8_9GAMM|nr:flagellar assembly peptidoglycan hydrolase FlgJ [Marinobacterium lacunae]KEA64323.1 Flagellar protein FlgJ [Marinobacterium lacunae]